jgi:hypothetical protein
VGGLGETVHAGDNTKEAATAGRTLRRKHDSWWVRNAAAGATASGRAESQRRASSAVAPRAATTRPYTKAVACRLNDVAARPASTAGTLNAT